MTTLATASPGSQDRYCIICFLKELATTLTLSGKTLPPGGETSGYVLQYVNTKSTFQSVFF